ncbi:MAG: Sulfur carrier protein FdhD [Cypionkella sp.]|uniref:formate dehydrogenase accessory sulfurtransferase FdhD n=1 Tax=Cypionkella sp. TaxID=2811411 RepID=UPI0026197A7C|nr:formate dehydrogenase accessory sulfurtransferase FdhD [Cypionkella sp.]MDB5658719.1 Sulfur carrier protein FdhD [Cypionkella sp.]
MQTHRPLPRLTFGLGADFGSGNAPASRELPEEVAVALSYNGSTQAVMMASPADLDDFAYGFSMTEGIATLDEIESIDVVQTPLGLDVQIWLVPQAEARLSKRRRTMAGPVGCGLCGIDSLQEATRIMQPVPKSDFHMSPSEVMAAVASLPAAQPLHDLTRAVHAAGYWSGKLLAAREDVGRHNALDKLCGHLIRNPDQTGAIVLTSRVSIDMVQKVAALGAPMLIAVSAPTAHAVKLADQAGITLIALARPDRFEAYTHTDRISQETAHVA